MNISGNDRERVEIFFREKGDTCGQVSSKCVVHYKIPQCYPIQPCYFPGLSGLAHFFAIQLYMAKYMNQLMAANETPDKEDRFSENRDEQMDAFFKDSLHIIYWVEKKLVSYLFHFEQTAVSPDLRIAYRDHLEMTREHAFRLEQIFRQLNEPILATRCPSMTKILNESRKYIENPDSQSLERDRVLINISQKIEHYEMTAYAGLVRTARTLGMDEIARILHKTLDEEIEAEQWFITLNDGAKK